MMTILQAFILGLIQGITEFLPVSSSGHLILIPFLFQWDLQPLYFDVALHLATLFSVSLFFFKDWKIIFASLIQSSRIKKRQKFMAYPVETRLGILLGLGTIPAMVLGFLFQNFIENTLRSPYIVVLTLVLVAGLMFWVENKTRVVKKLTQLKPFDALLIGFAQAFALIPGTSRSGITISTGIFRGLSREDAAKFSFMLSTPIIFGASLFEFYKLFTSEIGMINLPVLFIGFFTAMISGFLAISFLMKFLKTQKLLVFSIYRVVLAIIIVCLLIF